MMLSNIVICQRSMIFWRDTVSLRTISNRGPAAAKCYVKFRRWFTKAFVDHHINVSWETDALPTYKGLVGEIFDWLQHMSLPDMDVNSLHSLNQAIKALQKVSDQTLSQRSFLRILSICSA